MYKIHYTYIKYTKNYYHCNSINVGYIIPQCSIWTFWYKMPSTNLLESNSIIRIPSNVHFRMMFTVKKTNYSCYDTIYDTMWYDTIIWWCMIHSMVHITLNLLCQSNSLHMQTDLTINSVMAKHMNEWTLQAITQWSPLFSSIRAK